MQKFKDKRQLSSLVFVVALVATFFICWMAFRSSRSIQIGYQQKVSTIARTFGNGISEQISTGNLRRLKELAASIQNDPDITRIEIFDKNGKIFCQVPTHPNLSIKDVDFSSQFQEQPFFVTNTKELSIAGHTIIDFKGNIVGKVLVYMSRNTERRLIRFAVTQSSVLGTIVFLLSMIPIYFLGRKIDKNTQNLKQLNKELQAASRSKEQFLANMSHEIRTPMNSIIGYAELLEDSNLNSEQKEWISVIQHNGNQLIHLINQILNFSRIENQKLTINPRVVDIRQILNRVFDSFLHLCENQNLSIDVTVQPEVPQFLVIDPDAVIQCLNNLISNAIKFTDEGYVRIQGNWIPNEKSVKPHLELKVEDSGRGIEDSQKAEVFNAFSQLKKEDHYLLKGTGLGLNITKSIVELMGGEISLESTEGKGSIFTIRIPVEVSSEDGHSATISNVPNTEKEKVALVANQSFNDLRVMVAEDNLFNQKLILRMLKKLVVHADLTSNGRELVEAVEKTPYDVILMDINMPDMNGWEATQRIRGGIINKNTRIIAVTASADDAIKERCFKAGMNDFMGKPFRQKDLERILLDSVLPPSE